jgi:hypothetical protein
VVLIALLIIAAIVFVILKRNRKPVHIIHNTSPSKKK